jgi:hypothetical protein
MASALDAIKAAIKAMNSAIPGPLHGFGSGGALRSVMVVASSSGNGARPLDAAVADKFRVCALPILG